MTEPSLDEIDREARRRIREEGDRIRVHPRVAGVCPNGCGRTLFLGSGGHVTCSWIDCPNPAAPDELLAERPCDLADPFAGAGT